MKKLINVQKAIFKKSLKNESGFTLVELLLVIALISISVGVTSDILVTLTRSYNKTTVYNEIEQQANFISLKLEKELRNSTNVVGGGNQISLELNGATIYYNVVSSGGYTNIYRSVGAPSSASADALLSTPDLTGTSLGVTMACDGSCFTVTVTSPQIVDISMIFSQANSGVTSYSGNIVVKNTIVVRNTY